MGISGILRHQYCSGNRGPTPDKNNYQLYASSLERQTYRGAPVTMGKWNTHQFQSTAFLQRVACVIKRFHTIHRFTGT